MLSHLFHAFFNQRVSLENEYFIRVQSKEHIGLAPNHDSNNDNHHLNWVTSLREFSPETFGDGRSFANLFLAPNVQLGKVVFLVVAATTRSSDSIG